MKARFLRYQIARACWILALQAQGVAVGWQIYDRTGAPMDLGYVGLVQFIPVLLLWPFTGAAADRYDRRLISATCALGHMGVALLLSQGNQTVSGVLGLLMLGAVARAFSAPSQQALLPLLVTPEQFPRAVALNSTIFQVGATVGPALGGFLYAGIGPEGTYRVSAGLLLAASLLLATLPLNATPTASTQIESVWERLSAGLRFVRERPPILGAISLDLFAVLLGGATALLPIYAKDVLSAGPELLGMLRAAPAVGATLVAVSLSTRPIRRQAGPLLLICVGIFGAATVVFGLSQQVWISMVALAVLGAADEVSVVIRQTIVQIGTPDALRGRVSAVNFVFISVSNEVGQFESGLTAAWLGPVPAVVLGGLGSILVAVFFAWRFPSLRRIDRLTADEIAKG